MSTNTMVQLQKRIEVTQATLQLAKITTCVLLTKKEYASSYAKLNNMIVEIDSLLSDFSKLTNSIEEYHKKFKPIDDETKFGQLYDQLVAKVLVITANQYCIVHPK